MKTAILALSALSALALSAGIASAQMQPIPNPPETPHRHAMAHHHWTAHHGRHHAAPRRHHHQDH